MDPNQLLDALAQLALEARPRPDLGLREPVSTFAGRVRKGNEPIQSVMGRLPVAELETGGQAMTSMSDLASLIALGKVPGSLMATIVPAKTVKEMQLQGLMQKTPELWKRAQDDPRPLKTVVTKKLESPDALAEFNPKTNTLSVTPQALRPRQTGYPATPEEIAAHELLHYLNAPRVAATRPEHAIETASQIATLMQGTPASPYLQMYLDRANKNPASNIGRLLGTLSPMAEAAINAHVARTAYDEALSYLGEHSLRTSDPLIRALAQNLNLR